MPEDLEPLPLADVLRIVEDRRARRQRVALRAVLGAGAAVVAGAGVRLAATAPGAGGEDDRDGGAGSPTEVEPAAPPTTAPLGPDAAGVLPLPDRLQPWIDESVDRFVAAGLAYEDAVEVAAAWGTDPFVAKVVLGATGGAGAPEDPAAGRAALDALVSAYLASPYTYADAVDVAAAWEVEVAGAKAILGAEASAG